MKTSNLYAVVISLAVTAGLASGHSALQETAFALALVMNVLAWLVTFAIPGMDSASISNRLPRWIAWSFLMLLWAAMAYSGHPYLLASSLMVNFLHEIIIAERKKTLAMEAAQ